MMSIRTIHHGLDLWKESKTLLHFEDPNKESDEKNKTISYEDEDPWAGLPKHLKNKKKTTYIRVHSDLKTPSRSTKFMLLLWKDWQTLRRRWIHTLFEMFSPVLGVAILAVMASYLKEAPMDHTKMKSFKGTGTLVHDILPLTIVVGYMVPFVLMVHACVIEKESGIKAQMTSVEIPISYHRVAWILRCMYLHLPSAAIISAILVTNWSKFKKEGILPQTNPLVFFVIMFAYIFKTITFSIFVMSFFRRSSIAITFGVFWWIVSCVPYYFMKGNYNSFFFWQQALCCAFANTGISLAFHLIWERKGHGLEVDWINLFRIETNGPRLWWNTFTIGWIIIVMIAFGILELTLSTYVLKLLPEKGMASLPWNFCCKMWYCRNQPRPDGSAQLSADVLNAPSLEERFPDNFELDSANVKRRKELQLEKVTKYFGTKRVLHKLNLNCYEGDLTAIVGDPGSGKSTVLDIISGLMTASSGQITVSRQDMGKNRNAASSFVGYCPAENILYQYLSIEETLGLYCKLKCTASKLIQWDEVNRFVKSAMLEEYRNSVVHQLPKSTQRVLLMACAFIGGSRVVLLDEPTQYMNEDQKRLTWEFISQQKKHRTVIVAMTCLNEGDSVVDKVVCIQKGEVNCSGSVQFMHHKLGENHKKLNDIENENISIVIDKMHNVV